MALFKFLNGKGRYRGDDARTNVAEYILNPYKAKHGYIGGAYVNMESIESIVHSMDKIAQQFGKTNGVQLRHFVLSFLPQEIRDPQEAYRIGREIMLFVGQEYSLMTGASIPFTASTPAIKDLARTPSLISLWTR